MTAAIPALGLATYAKVTGDADARRAAGHTAELLLEHRLFRSTATGKSIRPSWTVLHYPAYWHYDVLQRLRLVPPSIAWTTRVSRMRRHDRRRPPSQRSGFGSPLVVE